VKRNRLKVEIFSSFEEENESENRRRAAMTPRQCLEEMAVLQERAWGKDWTSSPIEKIVSWEELDWWSPNESQS